MCLNYTNSSSANASEKVAYFAENQQSIDGVCSTASGCDSQRKEPLEIVHLQKADCQVTIAFVVCDQEHTNSGELNHNLTLQIRQLIVSLKSIAVLERYTGNTLGEHIKNQCVSVKLLTNDRRIYENVSSVVEMWDPQFRSFLKLSYVPEIYRPGHPDKNEKYNSCAATRLFLDQILNETDSIIYSDTDIVFLKSLQHLWAEFSKFKEETVVAMTPELYLKRSSNSSGYTPPSYNPGIILMNLTRMRELEWAERVLMVDKLLPATETFSPHAIFNAYFKHFPKQLHKLPCAWNFAPRNCEFGSKCAKNGIYAVHGFNQSYFQKQKGMESFQGLFRSFETMNLGQDFFLKHLLQSLLDHKFNSSARGLLCNSPQNFGKLVLKSVEAFTTFNDSKLINGVSVAAETDEAPINGPPTISTTKMCIPICLTFCEPPTGEKEVPSKQFNHTVVLLKSLVLMEKLTPNPQCITAIIVSDDIESYNGLVRNVQESWHANYSKLLHFTFVPVSYSKDFLWMKTIFKRCATVRLNYAELLPEYDAVIHLDTDMVFIRPPSHLWAEFRSFSRETTMMITPQFNAARRVRASRRWYWPTTLQSGVMLMNLTRIRTVRFSTRVRMISTFYRRALWILPVQIILVVYFHHFPEELTQLDCSWNYLPRSCLREHWSKCKSISAIHGHQATFGPTTFEPVFREIFLQYQIIDMKNPSPNIPLKNFLVNLGSQFEKMKPSNGVTSVCASSMFKTKFIKELTQRISKTS